MTLETYFIMHGPSHELETLALIEELGGATEMWEIREALFIGETASPLTHEERERGTEIARELHSRLTHELLTPAERGLGVSALANFFASGFPVTGGIA